MVTSASIQSLIIAEVGDTSDNLLSALMPTIWASYADKAAIFPRLQELYAKRRCIDIVRVSLRNQVTFNIDGAVSLRLGDRVKYLEDMRAEVSKEIAHAETVSRSNRPAVIGQMVNTEVETPPPPFPAPTPLPNPNAPWYHGDPNYPSTGNGYNSEPGSGR